MLPRLDPILYADPPPDDFEPKTGVELDSLFVTEHWQRKSFRGLHSWQNGPMMSQLWFSSKTGLIGGGHRTQDYGPVEEPKPAAPTDPANPTNPTDPTNPADPADSKANVVKKNREDVALETFHAERIQVNESGWFPFLRKDRWLDTVESDPFLGGGRWSVDNPKIWEVLSISIELFDRMLKAMVADRHEMLETILFGLLTSWESMSSEPVPFVGANYLLSQRFLQGLSLMQKLPNPIAFITQYTQADWNDRLINLMDHQTWAMVDRFRGDEGTWGATLLNSKSMIVIDSGIIKTMMAVIDTEQFVDEDGCTEIGFAAELRIFGGQFFMGPTDTNNKPFGAFRLTWPEPYLETIPGEECLKGHRSFKSGITMPVTRIPAIYASKMLSAEFWDDPAIPRKSDDYFHTNRIIISDTEYLGLRHSTVWTLASIESMLPTNLHPGEQELMTMWQERERVWTEKRKGWYPGALSWMGALLTGENVSIVGDVRVEGMGHEIPTCLQPSRRDRLLQYSRRPGRCIALFLGGEFGMTNVFPEEAADAGVGMFEVEGVKEAPDVVTEGWGKGSWAPGKDYAGGWMRGQVAIEPTCYATITYITMQMWRDDERS
ncbi:hypothetical protein NUW58_g4857 [Xylaria curta]|uniref:Uncharacterized protein n=1 Tax=Xylaria curta TaxID=42375 RepID=A0ACC1P637_9PEZI|nr:hypothetical protein NUW58_g4857 [Xylaria curta]